MYMTLKYTANRLGLSTYTTHKTFFCLGSIVLSCGHGHDQPERITVYVFNISFKYFQFNLLYMLFPERRGHEEKNRQIHDTCRYISYTKNAEQN